MNRAYCPAAEACTVSHLNVTDTHQDVQLLHSYREQQACLSPLESLTD